MTKDNRRSKAIDIKLAKSNLDFEEVVLKPSLRIWFIYCFVFIAALSTKLIFMMEYENFEQLWRGIVSAGALYLGYLYLNHTSTFYTLNALEVVGQSGIFSRKVVRIPLNRITNYECKASFLERVLGLNNVMIDTPGGMGFELTMSRLDKLDSDLVVGHLKFLMGHDKIEKAGEKLGIKSAREKAVANN